MVSRHRHDQDNMHQPRTYLKCKKCKGKNKCDQTDWCLHCFGFTLLEMLVVIAIIGLLAGVTLLYFNLARDKARVASVVRQVDQIDQALKLQMLSGNASWPTTPLGGGNYELGLIISNSPPAGFVGFSNYMSSAPLPPIPNTYYGYLNTGQPYVCGGPSTIRTGVNIRIGESGDPILDRLALDLDQMFDDGDGPNCGKIRYGISEIIILIANDSHDF